MQLPKILIINEAFNTHTGGGITLSNLFKGYDKDKLAVVCQSYLLNSLDTSVCNTYYQIGSEERRFSFPFNLLNRKHYSGLLDLTSVTSEAKETVTQSDSRVKLIMNYVLPALKKLGIGNNVFKTVLSPKLCSWLDEYQPDLIYAQAHDRTGVELVLQIHAYLQKPLIFHMMDDWVTLNEKAFAKQSELRKNDALFKKLLNKASYLMAISEEMASEYKNRYHKEFAVFHNPIDVDFWGKAQRKNFEIADTVSILYAGRLGLGIDESLKTIAEATKLVNSKLNISVNLVLQTKDNPAWIAGYNHVKHNTFVKYEDLPATFSAADFLILPYDFSVKSMQFIGYSMPTKATEYMVSGTPVIVFAPAISALVKYAEKYRWAKVVTRNNVNLLADAITQLIENKDEREMLSKNAIELATRKHASKHVTSEFRLVLTNLFKEAHHPGTHNINNDLA
jgi:glycosyltransferase involved in cell wall biosynthesis